MNKILLLILISSNVLLASGSPTFDWQNSIDNNKAEISRGIMITQMKKDYEQFKGMFDSAIEHTNLLNEQVESFNGLRTSISGTKEDFYNEINLWRTKVGDLQKSMHRLGRTIKETPENAKKMFDLSDNNYYRG